MSVKNNTFGLPIIKLTPHKLTFIIKLLNRSLTANFKSKTAAGKLC